MTSLIKLAIDALFDNISSKIQAWFINLAMDMISWVERMGAIFFDSAIVLQTLSFTKWVCYLIFGLSFIFVLIDIGEEIGAVKPGHSIEYMTIFLNFIKSIIFIEAAPVLAITSMQLGVTATAQMEIDYTALQGPLQMFGAPNLGGLLPLVPIFIFIALIGFFCTSLLSFGQMFVQAATVFLYIPDILRGRTTAMGDWTRQSVAIFITFMFRHILFLIGITGAVGGDYITMTIGWLMMFALPKLLQKYGMGTGFGGMVSHTASMGQSAFYTVSSLMH